MNTPESMRRETYVVGHDSRNLVCIYFQHQILYLTKFQRNVLTQVCRTHIWNVTLIQIVTKLIQRSCHSFHTSIRILSEKSKVSTFICPSIISTVCFQTFCLSVVNFLTGQLAACCLYSVQFKENS